MNEFKRESINPWLRYHIIQRDGMICRHCNETVRKKDMHLDHVLPVSKGGANSPFNLVVSCSDCNLSKGSSGMRHQEIEKIQLELLEKELRMCRPDDDSPVNLDDSDTILMKSMVLVHESKEWCKACEMALRASGDASTRLSIAHGLTLYFVSGGRI